MCKPMWQVTFRPNFSTNPKPEVSVGILQGLIDRMSSWQFIQLVTH